MNKKLLGIIFGLGIFALVFVACGSGDIIPTTIDDKTEFESKATEYKDSVNAIIEACLKDPNCTEEIAKSSSSSEDVSSSSGGVTEPPKSSSSQGSSGTSSSSAGSGTSSSSIYIPPILSSSSTGSTDPGVFTCAPQTSPINKGGAATWTSTFSGTGVLTANYSWTFEGGDPSAKEGDYKVAREPSVTYANSGSFGATLSINGGDPVTCSPLQVNGDPITGSCTASPSPVDIAGASATITYTMNAVSNSTITGYTWTKATGISNTATFTATEKGSVSGVSVEVSNDDNTKQVFNCPEVKVVDSANPEYIIDGNTGSVTLPTGSCLDITNFEWDNEHYKPAISVACAGSYAYNENGSVTVTYNGDSQTATGNNTITAVLVMVPSGSITVGTHTFSNICVEASQGKSVTCNVISY